MVHPPREVTLLVFESASKGSTSQHGAESQTDADWSTVQAAIANWPDALGTPPPNKGMIVDGVTRNAIARQCANLGLSLNKYLGSPYSPQTAANPLEAISSHVETLLDSDICQFLRQAQPDRITVLSDLDDDFAIPWEMFSLGSALDVELSQGSYSDLSRHPTEGLDDAASSVYCAERVAMCRQVVRVSENKRAQPDRFPIAALADLKALLILCPSRDLQTKDKSRKERFGATVHEDLKRIFDHADLTEGINVEVLQGDSATLSNVQAAFRGKARLGDYDLIYYYGHVDPHGLGLWDSEASVPLRTLESVMHFEARV
jgi:hypothetical protein